MTLLMYVELNIFSLVVLFLIFLNVNNQKSKYLTEQKLFLALLYCNAILLVLDTLMWFLDGKQGQTFRFFYLVVTVLYYIFNPLISMFWSMYAGYLIHRDERRLKKVFFPMAVPVLINAVLSVISTFTGSLFSIDANNIYHRGNLFYIMAVISYSYLVYTLAIVISSHIRNLGQKKAYPFIPILAFALPPFIGGIVQSAYFGISVIWPSTTISVLIIFINFQNGLLYTDHLTGLFNRRQLDNYLSEHVQATGNRRIGGVMMDLNSFKKINDQYGHSAGDQALEYAAEIFKHTFRKDDFIARYGGDEFVVIMEVDDETEMKRSIARLKENILQFNNRKIAPFHIGLSVGYDLFHFRSETVSEFLKRIDGLMYEDKMKSRLLKNGTENN